MLSGGPTNHHHQPHNTHAEAYRHGEKAGHAHAQSATSNSSSHFEQLDTSSVLGKFALIIIFSYLAVGCAFYSYVEEWDWTDALYFSVVTMTTVGYGDLSPTTDLSKMFTIGYILMGLSLVATCLGVMVGELEGVLESGPSDVKMSRGRKYLSQVTRSVCMVVLLLAAGACFVSYSEGWGLLDSFYWATVTASSVGYGDLVSENEWARCFITAYMLFAVGGCAVSLSKFGSIIMAIESDAQVDRFVKRGVTEGMIADMDKDGGGSIDKGEFLQYMLVAMGKVEQEDIDKVVGMFDQLDADGSGSLDIEDVRAFNASRRGEWAAVSEMRSAEEGMSRGMGVAQLGKSLLRSDSD